MSIDIETITLASGAHRTPDDGMCLLEAVAYVAGEPHTDRPKCVCPVLAAFGRAWNDALDDEDRNRLLKPFVPLLIGTRSTPEAEERRAYMAADWQVREATPTWLRAAGLEDEASSLESLAPLTSVGACRKARPAIERAQQAVFAAWAAASVADLEANLEAAWEAFRDAVWGATREAGMEAVWEATWEAKGASRTGVTDAARPVARAAATVAGARAAIKAAPTGVATAATEALRPHVERLQASAVALFHRMIEVRP